VGGFSFATSVGQWLVGHCEIGVLLEQLSLRASATVLETLLKIIGVDAVNFHAAFRPTAAGEDRRTFDDLRHKALKRVWPSFLER
jgi:hypothetical protein